MSKIGLSISINVEKLDKAKFHKGAKGTYLDLTTFVDVDNTDQYGQNGFVKQSADKGVEMPILGNAKVFWRDGNQGQSQARPADDRQGFDDGFDDDIPFR